MRTGASPCGQEREGPPGKFHGFGRVSPEAGAPGPDGRGEPQQEPAVLPGSLRRPLGFFQEGFGVVRPAGDHQGHRVLDEQPGPQALGFGRQCLQPTQHGDALAALHGPFDAFLDQPRREFVVGGGERVLYRLGKVPVALVPTGGTEVQLAHAPGTLAHEAAAQEVGEEVMVAVPAALVVQSDDEEVLPLQPLQHLLPVVAAGERVAQADR